MDRTGRTNAHLLRQLEHGPDARSPTTAELRRRHLTGENLRVAGLAGLFACAVAWNVLDQPILAVLGGLGVAAAAVYVMAPSAPRSTRGSGH